MKSNQNPSHDKTSLVLESANIKALSRTESKVLNYTAELRVEEAWNENDGESTKLGIKVIQFLGLPTFESGNGEIEDILTTKQVGTP